MNRTNSTLKKNVLFLSTYYFYRLYYFIARGNDLGKGEVTTLGIGRCQIWEMMQATTLGNLLWRAGDQRAGFLVTSLAKGKATNLGTVFLLVLAVYYGDGFDGR